jgi:hypothetical protein
MWVSIDLVDHVWQRNLADTLADYLNVHKIEPKSVITLQVTEKLFEGVGWQEEPKYPNQPPARPGLGDGWPGTLV